MNSKKQKIFIDSSILVEFKKQSKTELLLELIANSNIELVINSTVLSEYTFYLLAIEGEKAPRTIKENQEINSIISKDQPEDFLSLFTVLQNGNEIIKEFLELMKKYNLLPNDALILASCKLNNIKVLASFDKNDFTAACAGEHIQLVQSIVDFNNLNINS
ncbi:type II toxin-antitoxin system VapC family toxin [Dyadobacter sediminis]|uniref:PIN domain-containing protein n=1 Tax=Dyadobacter sediminis TaxID=1493691 RepID=A0A5R9K856_9BACT|nr:type II toxin-antitoxin system VapC family toxin [Dyadobacter sediminis]TLU90051.1 PIN domain-containing protein [Dyadobacter sediminis]GGC10598.1 nucleotide-binding protein [Dyadobacter sediminis]